jgi:hypothetical protein
MIKPPLDWDAIVFAKEGSPDTAELDKFTRQLLDKNMIVEKYKPIAVQEFRLAVMTAAVTAVSVELTQGDHNEAITKAAEIYSEIDKIQRRLRRIDKIKHAPPEHVGNILAAQHGLALTQEILTDVRQEIEPLAKQRAHNWRNTDIGKKQFVRNLDFAWRRLTVAKKARKADFERFLTAAFGIVGIASPDAVRYSVFGSKKVLKAE